MNLTYLVNSTLLATATARSNTTTSFTESAILSKFTICMCVTILILGLFGNSLVLLVFGSRWSTLKAFEIHMVCLAVADLIGTVVLPSQKLLEEMRVSFHYIGVPGCEAILFLSTISISISSFTLVVISVDRFIVVKWPLREKDRRRKIYCVVVGTWLAGMASGTVIYFVDGHLKLDPYVKGELGFICSASNDTDLKTIGGTLFVIQSGIPLAVMIVIYSMIVCELNKSINLNLFQHREREARMRYKRNTRATKLLIAIVSVFFVCTIPQKVFYMIYVYNPHFMAWQHLYSTHTCLLMLLMGNSCVNPMIYSKLHTSFRHRTLRLFCSCLSEKYRNVRWSTVHESFNSTRSSLRYIYRRGSDTNSLLEGSRMNFQRRRSTSAGAIKDCSPVSFSKPRKSSAPESGDGDGFWLKEMTSSPSKITFLDEYGSPRLGVLLEDGDCTSMPRLDSRSPLL